MVFSWFLSLWNCLDNWICYISLVQLGCPRIAAWEVQSRTTSRTHPGAGHQLEQIGSGELWQPMDAKQAYTCLQSMWQYGEVWSFGEASEVMWRSQLLLYLSKPKHRENPLGINKLMLQWGSLRQL